MLKRLLLGIALFVIVLAANLSATLITKLHLHRPSASDVRKLIERRDYWLHDSAVLKDVRKINGQMREIEGVKVYALEYQVTFTALTDGGYRITDGTSGSPWNAVCKLLSGRYSIKYACLPYWEFFHPFSNILFEGSHKSPMKKGQDLRFGGVMFFEKTEQGWRRGQDGDAISPTWPDPIN
jgi:hypothetical protein